MAFKVYYHATGRDYQGWSNHHTDETYDTLADAEVKRDELIAYAGDNLIECRVDEVNE